MIRIRLMADNSQEEAEQLLTEGGEVRSWEVLQRLGPMIYDVDSKRLLRGDVQFWRVHSDDGTVREIEGKSVAAAVDQNMEVRPKRDRDPVDPSTHIER